MYGGQSSKGFLVDHHCTIEKELLFATFSCRKFHDFIFGRQATIKTDHKPIAAILNKPLHSAPARLQHNYGLATSEVWFEVYKKGTDLYVAETSRSCIDKNSDPDADEQIDVLSLRSISTALVDELQKHICSDPAMQKVTYFIYNGWPAKSKSVPQEAQPHTFQSEMSWSWSMESSWKARELWFHITSIKSTFNNYARGILEWTEQRGEQEKLCIGLLWCSISILT